MYAGSSANVSIVASNFTSLRATVQHTYEHSVLILCMQSQADGYGYGGGQRRGGAVYGSSSAQIVIADSSFNACSAKVICLCEHAVTRSPAAVLFWYAGPWLLYAIM